MYSNNDSVLLLKLICLWFPKNQLIMYRKRGGQAMAPAPEGNFLLAIPVSTDTPRYTMDTFSVGVF